MFQSKGFAWDSLAKHAAMLYQREKKLKTKERATNGDGDFGYRGCFATMHDVQLLAASQVFLKAISCRLKDNAVSLTFTQKLALLELSLLIAHEHPQFEWSDIRAQVTNTLREM